MFSFRGFIVCSKFQTPKFTPAKELDLYQNTNRFFGWRFFETEIFIKNTQKFPLSPRTTQPVTSRPRRKSHLESMKQQAQCEHLQSMFTYVHSENWMLERERERDLWPLLHDIHLSSNGSICPSIHPSHIQIIDRWLEVYIYRKNTDMSVYRGV